LVHALKLSFLTCVPEEIHPIIMCARVSKVGKGPRVKRALPVRARKQPDWYVAEAATGRNTKSAAAAIKTLVKKAKRAGVAKKKITARKKAVPPPIKAKATGKKKAATPAAAPAAAATLQVDKVASDISGASVSDQFKLVLVDPEKNSDKYFVVQLLTAADGYYVVNRWGRTGTEGQANLSGPMSQSSASAELAKKFKEKTGQPISSRDGKFTQLPGKYDLLAAAAPVADSRGGSLWQYWVEDGIDGKPTGWYDYFADAATIVEGVYSEWQTNKRLDVRCVQSGSFAYRVCFNSMTQTNVSHPARKQRKIRRNV